MKRNRIIFAVLLLVVFVVGVSSRTVDLDSKLFNKYFGDALYAIAFYLLLGVLLPNTSSQRFILLTSVFVVAVECFQLTGIPLDLRSRGGISRLISVALGTVFSWLDLLAYFVGIVVIGFADIYWIRR